MFCTVSVRITDLLAVWLASVSISYLSMLKNYQSAIAAVSVNLPPYISALDPPARNALEYVKGTPDEQLRHAPAESQEPCADQQVANEIGLKLEMLFR